MSKVATADNHDPATFRAYFWSYSARELADEMAEHVSACFAPTTDGDFCAQDGEKRLLLTGHSPVCLIANMPDADSLDEVELFSVLEALRAPWKVEWLDDSGRVIREYDSDDPPSE